MTSFSSWFAPSGRSTIVVAATLAVAAVASPASAHSGGHPIGQGAQLEMWTDPTTGHPLPASLLYVARERVSVEDVAGHVHTWPLTALTAADLARSQAFRARVEQRHRHRNLNAPQPGDGEPLPDPRLVLIVGVSALVCLAAWRRVQGPLARVPVGVALAAVAVACGGRGTPAPTGTTSSSGGTAGGATATAAESYFAAFPAHVRTRRDSTNLYVESDGLADHTMMVGIRSWQQQVPLPAAYTGSNAWTIPLNPALAAQPVSARTGLFRGAIALAVNGVPIFNALNNRGDDAFLAGELDEFGGHAGRADDYHYHTAPLFLSATVGPTRPIAVALDGFALYGDVEPDGSPRRPLDDYNGHVDSASVYHYHGTRTYPYINGGMRGVVRVTDQVEPQPSVVPVRPAGTPLTGAVVTRHTANGASRWTLEYELAGRAYRVDYRIEDTRIVFVFTDPTGASRTETYTR